MYLTTKYCHTKFSFCLYPFKVKSIVLPKNMLAKFCHIISTALYLQYITLGRNSTLDTFQFKKSLLPNIFSLLNQDIFF